MHQELKPAHSVEPRRILTRFQPVMHLESTDAVLLFAETNQRFEERAVFGPAALSAERCQAASPAEWLAEQIEAVAHDAHNRHVERPVIIQAPLAALVHSDTALACDAAIRRTRLCPQEICIEVQDAALCLPAQDAQRGIEALRSKGFRVGLDATRSCQAPLGSALRLLLDHIRVDARQLDTNLELCERVEAAIAAGMSVIAEHANWRDSDYLASNGIDYGLRLRADA